MERALARGVGVVLRLGDHIIGLKIIIPLRRPVDQRRPVAPVSAILDRLGISLVLLLAKLIVGDGDLTLESAGDIGSLPDSADPTVAGPATIVVTGDLLFTVPGARIFGFVYTRSGNWAGSGEIQGAGFSEGNLAATAAANLVFNGSVIDSLRLRSGSFVRVPGGWRDFVE